MTSPSNHQPTDEAIDTLKEASYDAWWTIYIALENVGSVPGVNAHRTPLLLALSKLPKPEDAPR